LTGDFVINYSSTENLKRRCAGVFYRCGPSQASLCDDRIGRRWPGAQDGADLEPEESRPRVPGGLSSIHGGLGSGPGVVRDGGSAAGAGRGGEDGQPASGQSDRPRPDQDRQTGLADARSTAQGGPDTGGIPTGGMEPAGPEGDEDEGLLGGQANGGEKQDPGAFGAAERRDPAGGGEAGCRSFPAGWIGVSATVGAGGAGPDDACGPHPGSWGDPGPYQGDGRAGEGAVQRAGGGGPDRHDTRFCPDAFGVGGGGDRRHQVFSQAGGPSFLCRGHSFDALFGGPDVSWAYHQARKRVAEVGDSGGGLSGDQEGPGSSGSLQATGPEERAERGQDRCGPPAADDCLSRALPEEGLYSRVHETIGCLDEGLTGPRGSRSGSGLGAEIGRYDAQIGADRRVVQETEGSLKEILRMKKKDGACVSLS